MYGRRHLLLATLTVAALLASGCEMFEPPAPSTHVTENVGVDPTGENIDTSTLPPDDMTAEEEPYTPPVASAPKVTEPPVRAPVSPKTSPSAPTRSYKAPSAGSSSQARVGAAGMVHHHLTSSGDGSDEDSGDED